MYLLNCDPQIGYGEQCRSHWVLDSCHARCILDYCPLSVDCPTFWRQPKLCLSTKLRLYNVYRYVVTCCSFVRLWDVHWCCPVSGDRIETFSYMTCQRWIYTWRDFERYVTAVWTRPKRQRRVPHKRRRISIFGHVRRLPEHAVQLGTVEAFRRTCLQL